MQNPLRRGTDERNGGYTINSLTRDVAQLQIGHQSLERRVAEGQANLERDMSQMRSEFSAGLRDLQSSMQIMNEKLVSAKPINWQPVSIGVPIIMAAIAVGYLLISQQTTSSAAELRASLVIAQRDIVAVETRASAADVNINHRVENLQSQLSEQLDRQSGVINTLQTKVASVDQALVEVETQFAALETYDNLRFVALHRWFSVVYEKVFGTKFPEVFVEPKISRSRVNQE
jgi:hypothetical protein